MRQNVRGESSSVESGLLPEAVHVLLVDDDKELRDLLAKFLRERQVYVTCAGSLNEARTAVRCLHFHLVLMDVMLPHLSGLECVSFLWPDHSPAPHLKESMPPAPQTNRSIPPILFLSACATPSDRLKGLRAGGADYLTKPFEPEELLWRMRHVLSHIFPEDCRKRTIGEWRFDAKQACLKKLDREQTQIVHLSVAEAAFLQALLDAPQHTLTRCVLEESVGYPKGTRRLDVLVARLRLKMDEKDAQHSCIQSIRGVGYKLCWLA